MAIYTPKSGLTNSPFIGVKNFHVNQLLTDPVGGTPTYGPSISIPQIRQMQIQPQNQEETLYGDNAAVDVASLISQYNLTVETAAMPLEYRALLLGHTFDDKTGTVVQNKDDVAPYFAVSFESTKSNGKRRFVQFTKVKFQEPEDNYQTESDSINYATPSMPARAIYRDADGVSLKQADEEATGFVEETATKWYSGIETPAANTLS